MKLPTIVAIMNFFVWGSGYLYLRKAWGFWIVLIDVLITSVIGLKELSPAGYLFILFISVLFAWHGHGMAKSEEAKLKKRKK